MIIGLAKPNRGKVFLDEHDITHKAMFKRARMGMISGSGSFDLCQAQR
jgi:ABC-type lipopolysaccharide export system ATPase subunit